MAGMRFRDHVPVPVYADSAVGVYSANNNLRLQLVCLHSNYSGSKVAHERVPAWTLVMPITAAEEMANAILAHVKGLRERASQEAASAAKATRN